MLNKLKSFFQQHTLISLYTLIILLLLNGLIYMSGFKHLGKMAVFLATFYLTYVLVFKLKIYDKFRAWSDEKLSNIWAKRKDLLLNLLLVYTVLTVIAHFIFMGGSPPIQAMSLDDWKEVAQLRRSITDDAPGILNYISAFNIRAFLPFLIFVLFLKKRNWLYYALLILGCFYAFSLMQKSYVMTLLIPVFIYALLKKNWTQTLLHAGLMVAVVIGLSYNANPEFQVELTDEQVEQLEQLQDEKAPAKKPRSNFEKIVLGLWNRVMIIPGEMVSEWFEKVPEEKPFLKGDGYRIVAKLKGVEHRNYSAELYPLIRPQNAIRGLKGNVNCASFMYDYANFGVIGLAISGIILSLLFLFIEGIFGPEFDMKLSLNVFFILIISSTALTTTLFSGGWGLMIVLYAIFIKNQFNTQSSKDEQN